MNVSDANATAAENGDGRPTVWARVQASSEAFSPAERKVARALLANYPVAGLETVARLAERANVSGPTVIRFVDRLGFSGFPAFKQTLHQEVQERLSSPLTQYEHGRATAGGNVLLQSRETFVAAIERTFTELAEGEFRATVDVLADRKRPVLSLGGRFSQIAAYYLAAHLNMLRPNVRLVGAGPVPLWDDLVDIGRRHVFVTFDYRRHQNDVIDAARRAASHGATVVLFTDPWLSPIADFADHVLPSRVEAPSPFDSIVPSIALVEAVIAGVVTKLGDDVKPRIEELERLRAGSTWEQSLPAPSQRKR